MGIKLVTFVLTTLVLVSLSSGQANASLVKIDNGGQVIVKVLSKEDSIGLEIEQSDYLEVKKAAEADLEEVTRVSLSKEGNGVKLNISTSSGEKSLDVTNFNEEVIEVEARPQVLHITISVENGHFIIKQGGVSAETDYDIDINPTNLNVSLKTPTGHKFLSMLPRQALYSLFRSKLVDRVEPDVNLKIVEDFENELAYEISGSKVINVFNIFEYGIPITTRVSASTGEILEIIDPEWLKFLGFLYS